MIDLRKEPVAIETEEQEKEEESNKEGEPSELQEIKLTADVGMEVPK